jgi:hypothetical protein
MFVPGSISGYFAVLVAAALLWLAIFEVGCQFRRGNVIADSRKFALPHLDVSERGEGGPVTTGTRINWRILRLDRKRLIMTSRFFARDGGGETTSTIVLPSAPG